MKRQWKLVTLVVAVGLLASALLGGTVSAQGPMRGGGRGPWTGPRPFDGTGPGAQPFRGMGPGALGFGNEIHLSVAAELLDMTVEELEEALEEGARLDDLLAEADVSREAFHEAMLDAGEKAIEQAVKEGEITEEQAERLLERTDGPGGAYGFGRGAMPGPMGRMRGWMDHMLERGRTMVRRAYRQGLRHGRFMGLTQPTEEARLEILAEVLDMDADEIDAALEEGTTLAELAEEQGVELATVREALCDLRMDELDTAADEGRIDEQHAEQIREHVDEHGCAGPGPFPGLHPRGHRRPWLQD